MTEARINGVLGLAQKAGRLASGDTGVKEALQNKTAVLLIIAEDVAPNTVKELQFLAEKQSVETLRGLTRTELGACIGKAPRAAVAVLDKGFAGLIKSKSKA